MMYLCVFGWNYRNKLRYGCYMDLIIDLEVQELGALECMVFVPNGSGVADPTGL